jgi:hypothetical protein
MDQYSSVKLCPNNCSGEFRIDFADVGYSEIGPGIDGYSVSMMMATFCGAALILGFIHKKRRN